MVKGLLFLTARITCIFRQVHTGFQRHWEHPCSFIAERLSKVEPLTIAKLNEFVTISELQDTELICTGNGAQRSYIERSHPCVTCSNTNTVGVLRYRVEMSIADDTAEGLFVRFDDKTT
ncbi:Uncharacterized protein Rs2_31329 [Raphanus sativus]|nr:Uncharacterized protein Rs2_31329 [Raphanus sativus]